MGGRRPPQHQAQRRPARARRGNAPRTCFLPFSICTAASHLLLQLVIPVYHFVVMHHWTTSLVSTAPGSQNTAGEKALFYVFQAAPEVLSAGILLVVDVKSVFGTGMWGDRSTDAKKLDEKV